MRFPLSLLLTLALTLTLQAQPPALVAPTDALSPADEQKALKVPPGFEVQLVASEPQIQKPMQMAFDAKGRIWVTTSYHYPFAAPAGKATDKLYVLSDIGADGKAGKVTVFADFLNIPIGILPLPDCNSCIVSSVGEILKLTDTDGDGKSDKTEVLFTGFGSRDTHGMYNSFTLLPDGWVYACHGFNNDSKTKGKDGHEIEMKSGNTFRFRPDGSRIEVYTRGQVNPFGMAVDPWFNLYTADCHSKPITQLIPGATYESFGTTKDALGFGPVMFGYDPGGTGLCGISWYDADHFPAKYKGHMFLGNVVTSRVNMCKIEWTGATPKAVQQPDFVKSDDPWFRPVDIKLGPDGALYINDFYNKIIGHYEVDLKHPGRDKERGRVWRVAWKGKGEPGASAPGFPPKMPKDLTKKSVKDLVELLGSANITVRLQATNELISRDKKAVFDVLPDLWSKLPKGDPRDGLLFFIADRHGEVVSGDGNRFRTGELIDTENGSVIAAQVLHSMSARANWEERCREATLSVLGAKTSHIRRAALDAIIAHPHRDFVGPLIDLIEKCPPEDNHLRHAARIALRNCIVSSRLYPDSPIIADIALAIPNTESAKFLANYVIKNDVPKMAETIEHVARYGDNEARDRVVIWVKANGDWKKQHAVAVAFRKGVAARGQALRTSEQELCSWVAISGLTDKDANVVVLSCDLAGGMKLKEAKPPLTSLATDATRPEPVRVAALAALTSIEPTAAVPLLVAAVNDNANPAGLREKAGNLLGAVSTMDGLTASRAALKTAPYRVTVGLASGMAATKPGAEALLAAVKAGEASPRLLQEKAVADKLKAAGIADARVAELTKGLPPADVKIAALIKARTTSFTNAKPDKELGAKLYTKHCGACHQIGGMGGKVGPNLDGIGVRGLERLLEDTLDPNRNVDQAFRARVLNLVDGTSKTGMRLRIEGEVIVMADDQGKEFRVPMKDIDKDRETMLSPMPANWGEVIPEADFVHLLAYLLDQKAKDVPPKK